MGCKDKTISPNSNLIYNFTVVMTDKQLLVFTTLARTLSFGETARLLGISQPAVSKHVAALEGEIGAALFVRYGRSVALTDKGRDLQKIASGILEGYAAIDSIKE